MEYIEDLKGINSSELSTFIKRTLSGFSEAEKVLVLFPDYTRIDFTKLIAPLILERYKDSTIDFLNAGGTHRPMADGEFEKKLAIKKTEPGISFINHEFTNPDNLLTIGSIQKKTCIRKNE